GLKQLHKTDVGLSLAFQHVNGVASLGRIDGDLPGGVSHRKQQHATDQENDRQQALALFTPAHKSSSRSEAWDKNPWISGAGLRPKKQRPAPAQSGRGSSGRRHWRPGGPGKSLQKRPARI